MLNRRYSSVAKKLIQATVTLMMRSTDWSKRQVASTLDRQVTLQILQLRRDHLIEFTPDSIIPGPATPWGLIWRHTLTTRWATFSRLLTPEVNRPVAGGREHIPTMNPASLNLRAPSIATDSR